MKAARIHRFGPPEVIVIDDLPVPVPAADQVLVRVKCAGVGPWDALIREHKSAVASSLPLILGSDLAGVVEAVGSANWPFRPGDEVWGCFGDGRFRTSWQCLEDRAVCVLFRRCDDRAAQPDRRTIRPAPTGPTCRHCGSVGADARGA